MSESSSSKSFKLSSSLCIIASSSTSSFPSRPSTRSLRTRISFPVPQTKNVFDDDCFDDDDAEDFVEEDSLAKTRRPSSGSSSILSSRTFRFNRKPLFLCVLRVCTKRGQTREWRFSSSFEV